MMILGPCGWVDSPGRRNVAEYIRRMDDRPAFQEAMKPFGANVDL